MVDYLWIYCYKMRRAYLRASPGLTGWAWLRFLMSRPGGVFLIYHSAGARVEP